jgi:hypothetical protein
MFKETVIALPASRISRIGSPTARSKRHLFMQIATPPLAAFGSKEKKQMWEFWNPFAHFAAAAESP